MHSITGQPAIHAWAKRRGNLLKQLRQLESTQTPQVANIDMPKGLGLADEPCPGAGVLPALHLLLQAMRAPRMTAGRHSHGSPPKRFIHTMALVQRSPQIQRFAFLLLKENQRGF
jgi:hypothetical protein